MGTAWFAVWTVFVIFQVSSLLAAEESCVPGFQSELLIFKVSKRHLMQGTILGEVAFTDCTDRTRFLFSTDDGRFMVQTDGQLTVKRQVVLHGGHQDFFIHSWDSQGRKMTVHVMVLHHEHHHNHHQNVDHHHGAVKHHNQQHNLTTNTERAEDPQVPILSFPKSTEGLKRWKRAWIIPPLSVSENHRGPYPFKIAQIRSDGDKTKKIFYSITGPGADQAPVNLFTMNRDNGNLYVTQVLDREKQHNYTLQAHAVADGSGDAEKPMEIIVIVIDQNDNKPVFEKSTYIAQVPEASKKGFEVIQVVATDADEPNTDNSDLGYRIMSQDPEKPDKNMFSINPVTGAIIVNDERLDREKYPQYKLIVNAADLKGEGLIGSTEVIIKVTDSNDHAPVFTQDSYTAKVEENKVNAVVVRMSVTDGDEPHTPAWNAKFKIIDGDPGNLFSVTTGTNKQEGTITTVQGLDFEKVSKHTLLVAVVNDIDFAVPLTTSTATVTVNVQDVNEPPIFDPQENHVSKSEDVKPGSEVVFYTASDPDTARKQKVMYKIISDPAGWLEVKKDTGLITVKTEMDRESVFVQDNIYTALIGAYDDDQVPATGTGTLLITLQDVNDNAPTIEEREFTICNRNPVPQLLSVTDKDGPGFTSPYSVTLGDTAKANWTAQMNGTRTGIILNLKMELESGLYHVALSVADNQGLSQINTVTAQVCDCTGEDKNCQDRMGVVAGSNLPVILGVLAAILLLLLVVLLMLFARKGKQRKGPPLLQDDDDTRDNIFNYAEEGGGEEDQEYNLGTLHLGLDNRPMVMRDDVAPIFMPAPQYKPRPANPDDIGNFIVDNLKAADNDPTAPPYDSLLVFDYEGGGSEAGSLSSLNSSKSGDQDYNCLNEWGPRFKKLADMYGGGEDDDML